MGSCNLDFKHAADQLQPICSRLISSTSTFSHTCCSREGSLCSEISSAALREAALELGVPLRFGNDVGAVSELARNTMVYGGGGDMDWQILDENARTGLRLVFRDEGPGIPDIKLAMTDGWTSGGGLGLGLTGAKRLVEEFELDTAPGKGTRITITRWV